MTVIVGAADSTNLPTACCDAILVRNVFHYLTQPAAMIRSLAASLKPGDWSPEGVPEWVQPEIGRPFVAVFERTR